MASKRQTRQASEVDDTADQGGVAMTTDVMKLIMQMNEQRDKERRSEMQQRDQERREEAECREREHRDEMERQARRWEELFLGTGGTTRSGSRRTDDTTGSVLGTESGRREKVAKFRRMAPGEEVETYFSSFEAHMST